MSLTTITISTVAYQSYDSVAEADAHLAVDPVRSTTWAAATDDEKGEYLIAATRRLDLLQLDRRTSSSRSRERISAHRDSSTGERPFPTTGFPRPLNAPRRSSLAPSPPTPPPPINQRSQRPAEPSARSPPDQRRSGSLPAAARPNPCHSPTRPLLSWSSNGWAGERPPTPGSSAVWAVAPARTTTDVTEDSHEQPC